MSRDVTLKMFDGKEPPEEFKKDLKTFMGLPEEKLRLAFSQSWDQLYFGEKDTDTVAKELGLEPDEASAVRSIVYFFLLEILGEGLTLEDVGSDMEKMGHDVEKLMPILKEETTSEFKDKFKLMRKTESTLKAVLPVLDSFHYVIDYRGVFQDDRLSTAVPSILFRLIFVSGKEKERISFQTSVSGLRKLISYLKDVELDYEKFLSSLKTNESSKEKANGQT